MEIVQYLENFNLISIILRMTLATLFGGLIGLDRAAHGQSAGIRTFALVCLGSSMVMITNEYLFTVYGCLLYTSPSPRDPKTSRMPSSA